MGFLQTRLYRFWEKYEHVIGLSAMGVGFSFDVYLAQNPGGVVEASLLVFYLLIAAASIVILNLHKKRGKEAESRGVLITLLLVLQFCFGGLSSNLLVLYGKSGTITGSAVFIVVLAALLFGNEFMKDKYEHLRLNIALYYLLLFSYLIIAVPIFVTHTIGMQSFLLSGAISLVVISIFLFVLYIAVFRGRNKKKHLYEAVLSVALVFFSLNALYFLNLIPPVPLALKGVGVYHSISRDSVGEYVGTYEKPVWFAFWRDTSARYTFAEGQLAYCFSSVYAPSGLRTPIYHQWQLRNTTTGVWESKSRVKFSIAGGRQEGYRGFSYIAITQGEWRCNIETEQGSLVGRISFKAVKVLPEKIPALTTSTL